MRLCLNFPFNKDTSHVELVPILLQYDLIITNYIYKDPTPQSGHILRFEALGFSTYAFNILNFFNPSQEASAIVQEI